MWDPQRLTTLWAFTACYKDSFTFFFYLLLRWRYCLLLTTYRHGPHRKHILVLHPTVALLWTCYLQWERFYGGAGQKRSPLGNGAYPTIVTPASSNSVIMLQDWLCVPPLQFLTVYLPDMHVPLSACSSTRNRLSLLVSCPEMSGQPLERHTLFWRKVSHRFCVRIRSPVSHVI
jgi:hypothetical protein